MWESAGRNASLQNPEGNGERVLAIKGWEPSPHPFTLSSLHFLTPSKFLPGEVMPGARRPGASAKLDENWTKWGDGKLGGGEGGGRGGGVVVGTGRQLGQLR